MSVRYRLNEIAGGPIGSPAFDILYKTNITDRQFMATAVAAMNRCKDRLNYLFLQVFMQHLYKSLIVFSWFFCDFGKCN